jgi:hypothetical protein
VKYAVKLLTTSDLTLFAAYYRRHSSSKQKGINLNGDVLADQLFPALPTQVIGSFERPVTLDIYGPGGVALVRQDRKVIKPEGGKNWRLNGKLIEAPSDDPDRYSSLLPGDLAVFGFDGEPYPLSVDLVLLSQSSDSDISVLERFQSELDLVPRTRSMVPLTERQLAELASGLPDEHPLGLLLSDTARAQDLSRVGAGDQEAAERLYRRARAGRTRPISAAELERARVRAQEVGRAGEILLNRYLEGELLAGKIADFDWASNVNAVSPFDFAVRRGRGAPEYLEAKATSGKFGQPFHISIGELEVAAGDVPFRIARIFGVDDPTGAKMMVSEPISELAREIRSALNDLPQGVIVSSVQVSTDRLTWSTEVLLPAADDEEEDDL